MKSWMMVLGCSVALSLPLAAQARDTELMLSIDEAMASADAKEKLGENIKFYFGNQKTPKILERFGDATSNRKTNAFNKSDEEACRWAFLSAMIAMKEKAEKLGANAVVNIVSYYKKDEKSSPTDYECHAGALMAGVALKGDFVKVAR